jgi:alpha-1,2-mannosyltransferase
VRNPVFKKLNRHAIITTAMLLGTLGLAGAGFLRILPVLVRIPQSYDFAAYYVAARVVSLGLPLYVESSMQTAAKTASGILRHPRYIYPPIFAWLLQPIGALTFDQARLVWFGINVVLLIVAVAVLGRVLAIDMRAKIVIFTVLWLAPPVYDTLLLGQVSILLFCLVAVAVSLSLYARHHVTEGIAGVLIGLAASVKIYPIFILLPYLLFRRWWAVGAAVSTIIALIGVGLITQGRTVTEAYFTEVVPAVGTTSPLPVSQSVWSVSLRLFVPSTFQYAYQTTDNEITLSLAPIINFPILAIFVPIGMIVFLWIITLWLIYPRRTKHDMADHFLGSISLVISTVLITSPVTHDHYLVILLIPMLYLWRGRHGLTTRGQNILLTILLWSALLIVLQRYWRVLLGIYPSPLVTGMGFLALCLVWGGTVYHLLKKHTIVP